MRFREEEMAEAIKFAHEAIKVQCAAQVKLAEAFGKKETREYEPEREDEELAKKIHDMAYDKVMILQKQALLNMKEVLHLLKLKKK